MNIAIQNPEMGSRGGIGTYGNRLEYYLNQCKNVKAKQFVERIRNSPDMISIQYEPGCVPPQKLNYFIQKYPQPIIITAHHIGSLPQFYPMVDGIVLHSKNQIPNGVEEPWDYTVIPHPALVYPKKDKKKLRKKYGLPDDKIIIGTAGFIIGTGKEIPNVVDKIMKKTKDDEFIYCITSFWKGGDWGKAEKTLRKVKALGKEKQFRMDTDFVNEETLNEKMQCCDLLFAWNTMEHGKHQGSQSGIAADMYGSHTKLIVKDGPHYSFIGEQKNVLKGRAPVDEFAEDVIKAVRDEDLKKIPNPEHLSWQTLVKDYVDYFKIFME